MIILGLTGSIGMGKSTTAQMFRDFDIPVHDADKTVHDLYQDEAVEIIRSLFPQAVKNNKVDRQILGKIVLNNPAKMKQLESVIHPLVHEKEQTFIALAKSSGKSLIVLDIPLLFETNAEARVDYILVVTASSEEQKRRVLSRPNMNAEKFEAILARQTPDDIKRQKSDFLIDTQLGMEKARAQVAKIILELNTKAATQTG